MARRSSSARVADERLALLPGFGRDPRLHDCACGKWGCFGYLGGWYCRDCVPPAFWAFKSGGA